MNIHVPRFDTQSVSSWHVMTYMKRNLVRYGGHCLVYVWKNADWKENAVSVQRKSIHACIVPNLLGSLSQRCLSLPTTSHGLISQLSSLYRGSRGRWAQQWPLFCASATPILCCSLTFVRAVLNPANNSELIFTPFCSICPAHYMPMVQPWRY